LASPIQFRRDGDVARFLPPILSKPAVARFGESTPEVAPLLAN